MLASVTIAVKDVSAAEPISPAPRPKWTLTQESFDGLLDSLGADRDAAAHQYLEIRRNLVRMFTWRGCATPDDYADETINRCARKIAGGEEIQDLASYSIAVGRMLLLEMNRARAREPISLENAPEPYTVPAEPADHTDRVECLRCCLAKLPPDDRDFILHYYQGDKGDKIKNRKELTLRFGTPAATLRMRALRLREKLQQCVGGCAQGGGRNSGDSFPDLDSTL